MVKCSRKSVSLSDLWVSSHERVSDFYASAWQSGDSPVALLCVRAVTLAAALAILGWSVYEGRNLYWLVYLTNWGLVLVSAMLLSGLVVSIVAMCKRPPDVGELPWYVSMYWFFYNVAVSMALVITALYWILLYNPEMYKEMDARMFWLDVMTHGVNSCLAMVEVLAARTPVRLFHVYQPLGCGLWYAIFTLIYYAAGGTDGNGFPFIYEVLDWRQGKRTSGVVAAAAGGLIIVYFLVCGLAFCRDKFTAFLFRTTSVTFTDASTDAPFPGPDNWV
ncbi:protein rolling stone-like [Pectinophora gossypiella]|uniref:protein rolling stone-like n=1 Tax=Pectinophora gossypiella TaxID=13191 RepID=UPI00214E0C09|nr:protein rolling stone-like [Pectinophora gossypiella]